ncbi:ATP-binding protein [Aequorivita ciconiae]|uniref:ATP-binding protein n=1 Tax=Aequorivita ciconiae TaxID=2494375 RepID=UPI0013E3EE26|nr:ATP-binding protein [Aequorivita sp. H23M31]
MDFKKELYDFQNHQDGTSKFIKDILSFCNTVRNETSYIIFGIKEMGDSSLDLLGISENIDDSILQEKARTKIFPSPGFKYYTLSYKSKLFGILEFPVTKYEVPLSPTTKMKGLEPGKFYFRNGTSNTEASGLESIHIGKWLDSLPNFKVNSEQKIKTSDFIIRLSNEDEKLSKVLPELLAFATENNWVNLVEFCSIQIIGIRSQTDEEYPYRMQKVWGSIYQAEFNSNPYLVLTQNKLQKELNEDKNFFSLKLTFTQSLLELENIIKKFDEDSGFSITIQKRNMKEISKDGPDRPFFIYCLEDDYKSVYSNIRQKAIDYLMLK